MKTVAIVGCGKAKRDFRSKARNLYTSNYATKKRDFAEVVADDWFVLSAKHGLVEPDRRIDPYDVTADDVDPAEFNQMVSDQAERHADVFADADRVVVLAGSTYIDAVDGFLASLSCPVEYPFDDTAGIGDQMSVLKEMIPHRSPCDYRRQAAFRSPVDVYSVTIGSGISLRYNWPTKLIRVDMVPKSTHGKIRKSCDTLIVDSGIGNPDVTNRDVLDVADRVDADYVVPKDYLNLPDNDLSNRDAQAKTTESVWEFVDLYEDHDFDGEYFVTLQPPHDRHVDDLPDHTHYTIGGIKTAKPDEQIAAIRSTRNAVGPDAYIHALGMGASRRIIDTLREEPTLCDSVDTATPELAPARHKTPGKDMYQSTGSFVLPGGDGTSTGKAIATELILWQMVQMLNPDWEGDGNDEPGRQAGVESFA